jgi:predicted metal-dependent phosphotriesterase family hydrolase
VTAWIRAGEDSTPAPYAWSSPNAGQYNPDGLLHISRVAIPHMLEIGITQEQVDLVTREVPRRFLTGA